ncbi:hypothetical protein ACSBR1_032967 [Camellia fascicularis]
MFNIYTHNPLLFWSSESLDKFESSKEWEHFISIIWIGWFIWKDRNNFVFNYIAVEPSSTLFRARAAIWEFERAACTDEPQTQNGSASPQRFKKWQAPESGAYKINCDVTIKNGSSDASIAVLLRDSGGRLIDGLTKRWMVSSPLQGEALACRCACQLAQARNLSKVEIEGDNKTVICLCVSEDVLQWDCSVIFGNIKCLPTRENFTFSWKPRTANRATHWVAEASLHGSLPIDWVPNPPSHFALLLQEF